MEEAFSISFLNKILDNKVMTKTKEQEPLNFQADIVRPRRRLLAALGDLFLFYIIVALIFMLGIYQITKSLPSFKSAHQTQEVHLQTCRNMYLDGHLMYLDEAGQALSSNSVVNKYIDDKLYKGDLDDKNQYVDPLYYFYVAYANNNLKKDDVVLTYDFNYVSNDIYQISSQNEPFLWDKDYVGPAKLTEEARNNILKYVNNDINAQNKAYYDKLVDFYKTAIVEAEKVLNQSDQYQESYVIVMKQNQIIYYHFTISAIVTYIVFYFLYFLLVPALFKNGQTFVDRILKISFVTREDKPIPFSTLLLRSLLQCLGYFFIPLFIPYLILGNATFSLPMITMMGFTIDLWLAAVVAILLCIASFIFNLATTYKQNIYDKIMDVYALDLRNMHPILDSLPEDKKDGDLWK